MTGPKGNNEFCFPETLSVPRSEAEGNTEVEGKQTHCFLRDQSLSVLLYLPTPNYKKPAKKLFVLYHMAHK